MDDTKKYPWDVFESGLIKRRFWATEIDIVVVQVVAFCIALITVPELSPQLVVFSQKDFSFTDILTGVLFGTIVYTGYAALAESFYGATIGKRLLGLRVRSADSEQLPFGRYVVRNLLKQIEAGSWIIAMLFILRPSRNGKSLGDQYGKTKVIRV